jgi:preprotein translocase subunit SecB
MAEPGPAAAGSATPNDATNASQVLVQKIYVKDASIEVPGAPQVFTANAQPQIDINVGLQVKAIEGDNFDVQVTVTVTAKNGEDTVFLIEVKQAGVFLVRGFPNAQERAMVLNGFCPAQLFPYAREAVSDFVQKAGFPPFLLQPINFEALFMEQLARQRAEKEKKIVVDPAASTTAH